MSDTALSDLATQNGQGEDGQSQLSLGTAAARNLATTTKSVPQMGPRLPSVTPGAK